MAVEDSVAQDQLRAFIERIERMEEEKAAIAADIKEIYAEAKGNGFDTKTLRRLVTIRKQDANQRMEQEALLELYMSALGMIEAPPSYSEERERLNSLASQVQSGLHKATAPKPDPLAALRADPSMHIVDASNLKKKYEPQPTKAAGQAVANSDLAAGTSSVENEAAAISTLITEQQVAPHPASDLTAPPSPQGQVAPHSEPAREGGSQSQEAAGAGPDVAVPSSGEAQRVAGSSNGRTAGFDPVNAGSTPAPAAKYAAPGEVTYETHPPEGVERSSVSMAFGNMGQNPKAIQHDLEKGTAQPIVKQGKVILDGWARFMTARNMVELDGQPMAYPVVQYDGSDPLIDAIRWNVEGRTLDDHQKKLIAANLTRQNPARKDDIYRAFEIFLEPV
jgi:uncharacterized protein (UPF0335 family)